MASGTKKAVGSVLNRLPGVVYSRPEDVAQWISNGSWFDMTVGDALHIQAQRQPNSPAFISDERLLSFAELDIESDRVGAALLSLGLLPGDRVVVQLGTTIETVITVTGLYKAGLIPVCAIPQYREIEIRQLITLSGARAHIVQCDFSSFDLAAFADRMKGEHSTIEHVCILRGSRPEIGADLIALASAISPKDARAYLVDLPIGSGDVLSFQLSGGTTGIPKIIPRFHGEYLAHTVAGMRQFGFGCEDRMIWPLPLLHNAGQVYAMIPPLVLGSSTVILPKLDIRQLLATIERHQVTHAISIGPVGGQILNYKDLADHNLKSLRMFATMSGARTLEQHLGVPCVNLYGITEGLLLGSAPESAAAIRHESNGFSGIPDDVIRLVDPVTGSEAAPGQDGELIFRGPSSLKGYYGAPDATAEVLDSDGFFKSGDIMRHVEVKGQIGYHFRGRTRDNVNRGGEKIGCEEVETLVARHPDVAEARLVAMPDPIFGEKGCIFIIPRPGAEAPGVSALAGFLVAQGLAKFKCPERVERIDIFPVTRVGKLDRMALRKRIRELLEAESSAHRGN
ncbi:AMP-binding protein [Acidocella sp.]|uniref:AMP-binding protein n=1 Tax=Acidocella sp. TaxID=50710 RepID=UPI003D0140CA